MTQEQIEALYSAIDRGFVSSEIAESDVPSLELYMDQIITLLEEGLAPDRRASDDKLITKTMINNYSKDGLLHRIKGKKYSKQHVLMILLIYHLKQSLSISDISRMLGGLEEQLSSPKGAYEPQAVSQLYEACVDAKKLQPTLLAPMLEQILPDMKDKEEKQAAAQSIIALAALSSLCRRGAEELIDRYF